MNYRITHHTIYEYADPVTISHHTARLRPRDTSTQEVIAFSVHIEPEPAIRSIRSDYFGNHVCLFSIQTIHRRLHITAASEVSVTAVTPTAPANSPAWKGVADQLRAPVSQELVKACQFVFDSPMLPVNEDLADYARPSFGPGTPLLAGTLDLNRRIHRDFKYDATATDISTALDEVLRTRRGVCQDFAHLAIGCLRSIGLAARYVSGYIRTVPATGREQLTGADASHAWFSVFCPGSGWVDFDPTNDLLAADEHISVATGRDFSDVSPVSGIVVGGGRQRVHVAVDVEAAPLRPEIADPDAPSPT